jgi:hypothetical protein
MLREQIELLQGAIKTIKLSRARKGEDITEEEIAKKAGLTMEQLQAFLTGFFNGRREDAR